MSIRRPVPIKPHRSVDMRNVDATPRVFGLRLIGGLAASLAVASCGDKKSDDMVGRSGQQLEQAASQRGLFGGEQAEPVGIFERRNGDGRDRMCVTAMPSSASLAGEWRFAMELRARDGGSCLTRGTLRRAAKGGGDRQGERGPDVPHHWMLRFQGLENCTIVAAEQGDQLIFPAHFPASCSALCAGRVDLAGAELDRTSWSQDEAVILRMRRADGRMDLACKI